MCAPSPPPAATAPDYPAAARATTAGGAQAALGSNVMQHPDIYTPLGSQTWSKTGAEQIPSIGGEPGYSIPTYRQDVALTPEGQGLFDEQLALSQGLLNLGRGSLEQTGAALSPPMDLQSVQDIADQSYDLQTRRLDPQWEVNRARQENQLANQGLVPGGEAYNQAMRLFDQSKTDSYERARLASIATMPQTYQLAAAQRMQPLTELSPIRTGAQPQMPQFQPVQYQGYGGPNLLGAAGMEGQAAQQAYGQEMSGYNAMMGGLTNLGSAGLGAYGLINAGKGLGASALGAGALGGIIPSDRRLKRDIKQIGEDPRGFGIYRFKYLWSPIEWIGVMADEIENIIPEAVLTINGYKAVNYGLI